MSKFDRICFDITSICKNKLFKNIWNRLNTSKETYITTSSLPITRSIQCLVIAFRRRRMASPDEAISAQREPTLLASVDYRMAELRMRGS